MPKVIPWEENKEHIYDLYIGGKKTLADVREIMATEHNFHARFDIHHIKHNILYLTTYFELNQ